MGAEKHEFGGYERVGVVLFSQFLLLELEWTSNPPIIDCPSECIFSKWRLCLYLPSHLGLFFSSAGLLCGPVPWEGSYSHWTGTYLFILIIMIITHPQSTNFERKTGICCWEIYVKTPFKTACFLFVCCFFPMRTFNETFCLQVIRGLLKFWPKTCSQKEVFCL